MPSPSSLDAIRHAYVLDLEQEPHRVIPFRRDAEAPPLAALDVLLFPPPEGSNEDDITLFATAGMSTQDMPEAGGRYEMALEIAGLPEPAVAEGLARALAELTTLPFRTNESYVPDLLLEEVQLPAFDSRTVALLTRWDYAADWWLPDLSPQVAVIRVIPLTPDEAGVVREKGAARAVSSWLNDGVAFSDPNRPPHA